MKPKTQIIISCGTGGVGKTTISAATALKGYLDGLKVVVITIDPAKRLSKALGIPEAEASGESDEKTDLTEHLRKTLPITANEKTGGEFYSVTPNIQKSLESFFKSVATKDATADKILQSPIFQLLSKEFSGADEYMALQKLMELYQSGEYDLIVLDTPPSRNMLGFLRAPELLGRFFNEKFVDWILSPSEKWLSFGIRKVTGILESLTGKGFVTSVFEFAQALIALRPKFIEKLSAISKLLRDDHVEYQVITGAMESTLPDLENLLKTLRSEGMHIGRVVVNRSVLNLEPETTAALAEAPRAYISERVTDQKSWIKSVNASHPDLNLTLIPELIRDPSEIKDLALISGLLSSGAVKTWR